jgi:HD-like signal output (HDOD) protein/CheY-like chemotaxis protein
MKPIILFVDDDPMLLSSMRRRLRSSTRDWEMLFAQSGDEALKICTEKPLDIVISDMRMPNMNGATLLSEIRQSHPEAIRIILSGQSDEEQTPAANSNAHLFLRKPCETETLRALIGRCIAMRERLNNDELRALITGSNTIPVAPASISQVLRLMRDPNFGIKDISKCVRSDLAISTYILKLVNSSLYGCGTTVTDLDQAIVMLGMETLKSLICTIKLVRELPAGVLLDKLSPRVLRHSTDVALLARSIACEQGCSLEVQDDCYLAGMLHDFGKLVLASVQPEPYEELIETAKNGTRTLAQLETETFHCNHAEAGAYLLTLWGFDPRILEGVITHEDFRESVPDPPRTVSDFVYVANNRSVVTSH